MKKIIVIGEVCQDIFTYGEAKRLSPEAPVPVFIPSYQDINKGMAGNVVRNLKAISSEYIIDSIHQVESIKKTRYIHQKSNHIFIRVDEGEENISPFELTPTNRDLIKNAYAVIVSDYNKGFLTEQSLLEISKLNNNCFIDTKKKFNPETLANYRFIKLNENEFKNNFTTDVNFLSKVIVTLGDRGATYMGKNYPTEAKETIDVSGAGDTFLSAFVVKYLDTFNIDIAITFANKLSSIVVSKRGVNTP